MKKIALLLILIFLCNILTSEAMIENTYKNGIYHIVLTGNNIKKEIQFVSSSNLATNNAIHKKSGSKLTINTGFFDPKNQKTISYIVNDYQTIEDPLFNENLMSNYILRKNLNLILNRTEFRVLDCDGKIQYQITPHDAKLDFACSVKTSAQGGPQLLPNLRLEEEFFVVKDEDGNVIRESASVLHKTPRTLIGIKNINNNNQEVHIFIVTNENPMTIYEARDLCKSWNLDSAMAFDGGSSTSLDYNNVHVISTQDSGDTGRALKSFMIIRKK